MANLAAANVLHRKTRSLVAVLAVAVEVATVMLLVGLANGTLGAIARRLESVGADVLLQPPDASLILGVSSAVMPVALGPRIAAGGPVEAVAPVLNWQVTQLHGEAVSLNLWAVDPAFAAIAGGLDLVEGRDLRDPGDLVVDQILAEERRLRVGEEVRLLERVFRLVGISRPGSGGRVYARLDDIGEAIGSPGKASFFLVRGRGGARHAGDLAKLLKERFPGYKVTAIAQVSRAIQDNAVGLRQFRGALTSLAVVISFLVVLLAMYTAVLERTREIGILRSMGATRSWVVRAVLAESGLLCAIGAGFGVLLAVMGRRALLLAFPAQDVDLSSDWALLACALGVGGGLLGSLYPALRAARLDPIQALAHE